MALTIALIVAVVIIGVIAAALLYCVVLPRQPYRSGLPALTPDEQDLAKRLRPHVVAVASDPHNLAHYASLEAAARYIEQTLLQAGLEPRAQIYDVEGRRVRNIEVVLEPQDRIATADTYVIGAHYDSPDDSPGANDNGTGVAALLELARLLATHRPGKARIRLAFFVNEEQPYFKTEAMGSWRYAKSLSERGERVRGMMALETIGYFSNAPGSQRFPAPFGLIYANVGNFVAFVGLLGARRFVRRSLRSFRRSTAFPSIGGVAPGFIPGIALSDHWAFHQFGFPALMITDTAPYRNPRYHQLDDVPESVDYESLARITKGLERVARDLADR
jgi:hypothetical protein